MPGKPIWLKWVQSNWNHSLGLQTAVGKECYECYFLRKKHFGIPQLELLKNMEEHDAVQEKVFDIRADHTGGGDKYKKAGTLSIEQIVEEKEENFEERFVEGQFQPLDVFCRKRSIDVGSLDEAELGAAVQLQYPSYEVGYNKEGILGVSINDTGPDDGSYRFKRGARDSQSFRKLQKQPEDEDGDAEQHFKLLKADPKTNELASRGRGPAASGESLQLETCWGERKIEEKRLASCPS